LQRGSLFHDAQFELFTRLQQQSLLPIGINNLEQAWQQLDVVLVEVAGRYRQDLAPAIDRVWDDGISSIRADLREWLRRASEDDTGFAPWRFELSFGLARRRRRRPTDSNSVGESRFFSGCDVNGLGVAKRSPATTSALEARQRPSSHRGQLSATELRKITTLSSLECVAIVLIAIIVESTAPVYSFEARRPPTSMPRGLPLLQQLQCRDSGFVQSLESQLPSGLV
jgi:hypothetical protein